MSEFLDNLPVAGAHCPTCSQFAKVYRRKLNSGMARCLIWLVKDGPEYSDAVGWVDVARSAPRHVVGSREFDKLAHWEMVEMKPNTDGSKRVSGFWRATEYGKSFARRERYVSSHAVLYNGELLGLEGDSIDIVDALGKRFSYAELMAT